MQTEVVSTWLSMHPNSWLFAVPNGGYRSFRQGATLKREGVRPGVTDLILPQTSKEYYCAYLELKMPGGSLSDDQIKFILAMREQGYAAAWAQSVDDAIGFLTAYVKGERIHG